MLSDVNTIASRAIFKSLMKLGIILLLRYRKVTTSSYRFQKFKTQYYYKLNFCVVTLLLASRELRLDKRNQKRFNTCGDVPQQSIFLGDRVLRCGDVVIFIYDYFERFNATSAVLICKTLLTKFHFYTPL